MPKNKFAVSCPYCNKPIKKLMLGADSYVELECPHCKAYFMAKSKPAGIKTNCLVVPQHVNVASV